MPTARAYAGAAVAGGKIYVVGGFDGKEALAVNEAYSPERSAWVKLSSLSSGRYALGLTSVADIIYMIGGEEGKALLLPPLNYNYQQDKWQEIDPPFLQRWSYIGLVPFQTRVYAFGGLQNDIPTANNLSYQAIYAVTIPIIR
jgi:N-acetylneuraminic acid mutarotase